MVCPPPLPDPSSACGAAVEQLEQMFGERPMRARFADGPTPELEVAPLASGVAALRDARCGFFAETFLLSLLFVEAVLLFGMVGRLSRRDSRARPRHQTRRTLGLVSANGCD